MQARGYSNMIRTKANVGNGRTVEEMYLRTDGNA